MEEQTKKLTKENLIDLLVANTATTLWQWAIEGNMRDIEAFVREELQLDKMEEEELYNQAHGLGLLDES